MENECTNYTHIELGDLNLMVLESFGVKSQVNAVSASSGSGPTTYNDFTDFSFWAMDDWSAGALQKNLESPGYQYGTLDTRFDSEIILPPDWDYEEVPDGGDCPDAKCHFVNRGRDTYLARGTKLYQYVNGQWDLLADTGVCATDLEWWDEYLHIGGETGQGYRWYRIDDGLMGFGPTGYMSTPPSTEFPWGTFDEATMFYAHNGFLYAVQDNQIWYTSGQSSFAAGPDPTATPDQWEWIGPLVFGGTDEPITGLAGIQFETIASQQILVSTPLQLFDLLPGDITASLTDWESIDEQTGVNAIAYNGDAYFPVGDSLYRVTRSGQIVNMGLDTNAGLPCSRLGRHQDLERMRNYLLALIDGPTPTVWAWANGGWHFIGEFPSIGEACSLHYSQALNKLWVCGSMGMACMGLPDTGVNPLKSATMYQPTGYVDLPPFRANLFEITKDFHSISVHGRHISEDTPVNIWYRTTDPDYMDDCTKNPDSYDGWSMLGEVTEPDTELYFECSGDDRPAVKTFWLRIELSTRDSSQTPVVDAVRVKYMAMLRDTASFNYTVPLPFECLRDMCGIQISGYNQGEWDCILDGYWRGDKPIRFEDVDGRGYFVKIVNAVRRSSNFRVCNGQKVVDYDWSLGLLEMDGCSEECDAAHSSNIE